MSCSSWQRSCWWFPSRLSKCRRSCLTIFHRDVGVATRSWCNSWWKCRRPCPTLRYCSGLWSSTSTFQFLVVVEGETLVFKVFSSGQRSTASPSRKHISDRIVEQIVDPVSRGGLHGSSSSHSPAGDEERADEPGKRVFRTFPQIKKSAKVAPHSGSELPPHSSSWTAAAQLEDSVEWVRLRDKIAGKTYYWHRRTRATDWQPPPGVKVVWNAAKNEEGARYFWHRDTRVSTFVLPPLPPE